MKPTSTAVYHLVLQHKAVKAFVFLLSLVCLLALVSQPWKTIPQKASKVTSPPEQYAAWISVTEPPPPINDKNDFDEEYVKLFPDGDIQVYIRKATDPEVEILPGEIANPQQFLALILKQEKDAIEAQKPTQQ